jgi:hypothetical protein
MTIPIIESVSANQSLNADVQKRRCAPHLHAGSLNR